MITDRRVLIEASFVSWNTLIWIAVIVMSVISYVSGAGIFYLIIGAIALGFVIQRRPYRRDVPFEHLRGTQFGTVRGVTGRGDIVALSLSDGAIHLVTARPVPEAVRRALETGPALD